MKLQKSLLVFGLIGTLLGFLTKRVRAQSRGEVELSASILRYFADNAQSFLAPKKLNSPMGDARLEYSLC